MNSDIKDDEIRIIKKKESPAPQCSSFVAKCEDDNSELPVIRTSRKWGRVVASLLCMVVISVIAWLCYSSASQVDDINSAFEPELTEYIQSETIVDKTPFSSYRDSVKARFTEVIEKEVNDIPMCIYIPHNSTPVLRIGVSSEVDSSIVFATQAADLRADNGKIVGAFVMAGEPLSWGLSKKGYCAVIDGKITIGMADNSPLFEEATEKGGYFFRQYALVSDGQLVENNLRNKSIRKALCARGDEVFVVMTLTRESMHDFSQALVDLGVDNAIYVVGGLSHSFYLSSDGVMHRVSGDPKNIKHSNANFIEWR